MKITIIKAGIVFILLALILGPVNILAEEEKPIPGEGTRAAELDQVHEDRPELSADVAFLSQYIWRGQGLSKDSLVIQPSVTASYKGFSLNLWGNLDTSYAAEPYKDDAKWNETDMTFSYGHSFGMVGLEAGFIYYALDGLDDWKEFYLSLGLDTLLAPTVTVTGRFPKTRDGMSTWGYRIPLSCPGRLPSTWRDMSHIGDLTMIIWWNATVICQRPPSGLAVFTTDWFPWA